MSSIGFILLLSLIQCDCGNKDTGKGSNPATPSNLTSPTDSTPLPPDTTTPPLLKPETGDPTPKEPRVTPDMLQQTEHLPDLYQTLQKLERNESIDWSQTPNHEKILQNAINHANPNVADLLLEQGATVTSQLLWEALEKGDAKNATKLISKASLEVINQPNAVGYTSLMLAVQKGHTALANQLLNKGADREKNNNSGETAFSLAIQNGYEDLAKLLQTPHTPITPSLLWHHLKNKNFQIAKNLIKHASKSTINSLNELQQTPLMAVIQDEEWELADILMNQGADLDIADNQQYTPLILAADKGHTQLVKQLLQNNADVNKTNVHDDTALSLATQKGYTEIVNLLKSLAPDLQVTTEILWQALDQQDYEKATELVQRASKEVINTPRLSATPLMMAVTASQWELSKQLIDRGADIEAKDPIVEKTSLMYAAEKGQLALVQKLIQKGTSIDTSTKFNQTAVSLALENGHQQIADLLLQKGATVTLELLWQYLKAYMANQYIADLLIEYAPITILNTASPDGKGTPLIWAAQNGYKQLAENLLKKPGIELESKPYGKTALYHAVKNNYQDIVNLLLQQGAQVDPALLKDVLDTDPMDTVIASSLIAHASLETVNSKEGINSFLYLAIRKTANGLADQLLEKGASVDPDELWLALKSKNSNLSKLIAKASIKTLNKEAYSRAIRDDSTPLMYAAHQGYQEIVAQLLEKPGINKDFSNTNGDSALSLAIISNHLSIADTLKRAAVKITPMALSSSIKNDSLHTKKLIEYADLATLNTQDMGGSYPLELAIDKDNQDLVNFLLAKGADVNEQVLWKALNDRKWTLTDILIKKASVSVLNNSVQNNLTPLMYTIQEKQWDLAKYLINKVGININKRHQKELNLAIQNGNPAIVKILLDKGVPITEVVLSWGVQSGNPAIVNILLDKGAPITQAILWQTIKKNPIQLAIAKTIIQSADPGIINTLHQGDTPLTFTTKNGYQELVEELLIRPETDRNKPNNQLKTALGLAIENKHQPIIDLFINDPRVEVDAQTLWQALKNKDFLLADQLVDKTIPSGVWTSYDDLDLTPLMFTIQKGEIELAKKLGMLAGDTINYSSKKNHTALSLAIQSQQKEMAEFLLNQPPIIIDPSDLQEALTQKDVALAKKVINKTEPAIIDNGNTLYTSFLLATTDEELFKLMIAKGANVNLINGKGESLLIQAILDGNQEAAILLFNHHADINITYRNKTPLQLVRERKNMGAIEILLIAQQFIKEKMNK